MKNELIKKPSTSKPGPGRPSDYRPEFCEQVVEFMSDGSSLVEFAASINVSRQSLYEWGENHPEFSDALARAKDAAAAYLRKELREGLGNREFNAKAALNHLRLYDSEANSILSTQRSELTGAGGKPLLEAREAAAIEIAQAIIIARQGVQGVKHPKEIEGCKTPS